MWEPYNHDKYSCHIRPAIQAAFPNATIRTPHKVGEQLQGDGWSCGYICLWWQIAVEKLIESGDPPVCWEKPTEVPALWKSLIWSALRVYENRRDIFSSLWVALKEHDLDAASVNPVRDLLADDWGTAMDQGKLGRQELNSMKKKLEDFVGTLPKASARRRSSRKKKVSAK